SSAEVPRSGAAAPRLPVIRIAFPVSVPYSVSGGDALDEIRRLHESRQTGLLTLAGGDGERVDVFFREGLIEAASSTAEGHRLGQYLVRAASLEPRDVNAAAAEGRRRKLAFGEAILRRRLADPVRLGEAVRRQSIALVEHALRN